MDLDKETKEEVEKGKKFEKLVDSEGWELAKGELLDRLIDLDSINALPSEIYQDEDRSVKSELKARQSAIDIVLNWIKEVEGNAEQSKENRKMLEDRRKQGHILNIDE